jgi:predicted anti-sigma-YlaC factor YlaD
VKHQEHDLQQRAQSYVDSVLEAQRRSGHDPEVTDEAYASAVERAAAGFARLTDPTESADEDAVPA